MSSYKDDSLKRHKLKKKAVDIDAYFTANDDAARETFFCEMCEVELHDLITMDGHLNGKPHLKHQQRVREHHERNATRSQVKVRQPEVEYRKSYGQDYDRKKTESRRPKPELILDEIEPKFKSGRYDLGQFDYNDKDFHCSPCGVYLQSRDQMQQHKEGNRHKKQCAEVVRYECQVCSIKTTCKESLVNHKKGQEHLRRVKLTEKNRKHFEVNSVEKRVEYFNNNDSVKIAELEKLLEEEKTRNRILQRKVKDLQDAIKYCADNHENVDFEELLKHKKWCIKSHQQGLQYKLEIKSRRRSYDKSDSNDETDDYKRNVRSTQRSIKSERCRSYHESDSDENYGELKDRSRRRSRVKSERSRSFCDSHFDEKYGNYRESYLDNGKYGETNSRSVRRSHVNVETNRSYRISDSDYVQDNKQDVPSVKSSSEGRWRKNSSYAAVGEFEYIESEDKDSLKIETKEEYVEKEDKPILKIEKKKKVLRFNKECVRHLSQQN